MAMLDTETANHLLETLPRLEEDNDIVIVKKDTSPMQVVSLVRQKFIKAAFCLDFIPQTEIECHTNKDLSRAFREASNAQKEHQLEKSMLFWERECHDGEIEVTANYHIGGHHELVENLDGSLLPPWLEEKRAQVEKILTRDDEEEGFVPNTWIANTPVNSGSEGIGPVWHADDDITVAHLTLSGGLLEFITGRMSPTEHNKVISKKSHELSRTYQDRVSLVPARALAIFNESFVHCSSRNIGRDGQWAIAAFS